MRRGIGCKHVMLEGGPMVRRTDAGARSRGASDSRSRRRSRNPYLTWTSDKDLCTRTHAPSEWLVRVMARVGCGHFTSNVIFTFDSAGRGRRPAACPCHHTKVKMSSTGNGAQRRSLSAAAAQVQPTARCSPPPVSAAWPRVERAPHTAGPSRKVPRRSGGRRRQCHGCKHSSCKLPRTTLRSSCLLLGEAKLKVDSASRPV